MRHAISSIFNAAVGARKITDDVILGEAIRAPSTSMMELRLDQLRLIVGGDNIEPDGLPKGGWKTTQSTAS